ncbi:MAG: cytochrome C [Mizugakiibacter sp.]|uniref:cytochrome C n=1 Tax=Mizugakiibacter sp. TaxID=1972610 RepID=UPI0031BC2F16|nr:cytochrome c [Xanthomonadaceae bacterium]
MAGIPAPGRYWTGAAAALAACLALANLPAVADGADAREPPALRGIMLDLDGARQAIADGIAREDWRAVAEAARRIAEHPQPPLAEKMRILAFVGSDAGRFRGYDRQAREAARAIGKAARRQDRPAAAAAFAAMQDACIACHATFRKPFQERFPARR